MFVLVILIYLTYRMSRLWTLRHERTRSWWLGALAIVIGCAALWFTVHHDLVEAKILGLLCMPTGLVWMVLAAMAAYHWAVRRQALAILLSLLFVLDTLSGNAWLGALLLAHLENQITPIDPLTSPSFDAICVLGGGVTRDANEQAELGDSGDRVMLAAQWFHSGKTPLLVCSGTTIPAIEGASADMAAETANLWRSLGIPGDAIISLRPGAINTSGELAAYKSLIEQKGWHRVGLLSSAWHLPRALLLCRHLDLTMVPIPADRRSRMPPFSAFWLIPQDGGFRSVQIACREYLGMVWGR